ncbi:hypothetical protein [Rhodovulum sp. MB263]|uniref:hypothetical protein n=1 Tax=Rhodovulum sp. (strain MB263) TaxID=308754 RepID=UPI0009B7DFF0|nr:hypothetical protein B5V46_01750 [Rhodovulum sp. MB263]
MSGNAGQNLLYGLGGDDTLLGAAGDDGLLGGRERIGSGAAMAMTGWTARRARIFSTGARAPT